MAFEEKRSNEQKFLMGTFLKLLLTMLNYQMV